MDLQDKKPVGRPTVVTPEIMDKLQYAFMLGCTDEEACFYAGIAQSTLYNYQKEHPEFLEQKDEWKLNPVFKARQTVINNLGDPEMAFKYLERKRKDEFSPKTELSFTGTKLDEATVKKIDELMGNDKTESPTG